MGEGRSEASHWLRFVTSQGGGYLTIESAVFVPQNEEAEMERPYYSGVSPFVATGQWALVLR